jgi:hypothetical protein
MQQAQQNQQRVGTGTGVYGTCHTGGDKGEYVTGCRAAIRPTRETAARLEWKRSNAATTLAARESHRLVL